MATNTTRNRRRPTLVATVSPEVKAALDARAERDGVPTSRVVDLLLRRALRVARPVLAS